MSIDRRAALRLFALGATPVSVVVRADGDSYYNRRLGLSVTKPSQWHFISLADHWSMSAEHRRDLRPEARQALEEPEAVPILVVAKYKKSNTDAVAPSFTVHDESTDEADVSALALLQAATRGFALFARETEFGESPTALSVPGASSAAGCNWSYSHPVGGRLERVDVRTIMALRGRRVQTFHFFCPQKGEADAPELLLRAERSITYAEA